MVRFTRIIYIDKTIASMPKTVKDIIKLKGPRAKY